MYDYKKGIVSIVNAKGAPGTKALGKAIEAYTSEYKLEFHNIPNEEGIRVLYNSESPQISKLEFEVPTPDAEFLQSVLGLDEEVIREMIQDDVFFYINIIEANTVWKVIKKKRNCKKHIGCFV